jgi:hypothetical protein
MGDKPMSQKEHLVDVQTNIGTITYVETTRKNRPDGLRKPYEYVLPMKRAKELSEELRAGLKDSHEKGFQCSLVERKGLASGIRLHVFVLGYKPGLCGANDGVSPALWGETVRGVQRLLTGYLGKDARAYVEPYSNDKKFQLRFETYVMYEEFKKA